jgi:hypothetical protein
MKKYLLTVGLAFLIPAVIGMEGYEQDREGSSPPLTPINAQQEMQQFTNNPENYEYKGGLPLLGIFAAQTPKMGAVGALFENQVQNYNMLLEQHHGLLEQLKVANEALQNMSTLQRAIKEAHESADNEKEKYEKEAAARHEAESQLIAARALNAHFKQEQTELLSKISQQDVTLGLNQARQKLLEERNLQLTNVISDLSSHQREIEALLSENNDFQTALENLTGEPEAIEEVRKSIAARIDKNREKITELKVKCEKLDALKTEKEQEVEGLKKAIEANDYYTQILKMIKEQSVTDDELALFMFSVQRIQGVDLDELSEGREKRLIEVLIRVSYPNSEPPAQSAYNSIPEGCTFISRDHPGRFRRLGNDFIPSGGLGWIGKPLNLAECIFPGSKFEKNSVTLVAAAKKTLKSEDRKHKK